MAKVSVIIPAYNAAPFIHRAVTSVLNQQGIEQPEVIVIDDCSPDDVKSPLKDLPVTYFRNETNIGPGPARNVGMDMATGEYLLFLDADDELGKNQLATLMAVIEKENADISYCPALRNTGEKGVIAAPRDPLIHILSGPSIAVPALMFRRDKCPRFDPAYICEDREWQTRMIMQGLKFTLTTDTCYWYHITGAKERYKHFSEDCARMRVRLRNWLLSPKGGQATGVSMFKLAAAHLKGSIHDSLSKGNLMVPQAKRNIVDAASLLLRFMDEREKDVDMLLLSAFHFYKTGAWRIPEVEIVGTKFPELFRLDEQNTRSRLHDEYVDALPEKTKMLEVIKRELGDRAAHLAEFAYTRVKPEDVKKQPSIRITPEMLFDKQPKSALPLKN